MEKNKNVPQIRFAGFTDDWEQRKLGEIATFSKGQGYSKSDLRNSGFPIILYGQLYTNYQTAISDVTTFVKNDQNAIKSLGNEVIVPASGETAEDIARASAIEKQGIIIGGDLNIVQPDEKIKSHFLALTLSSGQQKKELSKKAQGKSVVHIRNNDLKDIEISFPQIEEQTAISNFFKQLDETIALHQREYEKYQNLKKSYLEKMFPKENEQFPEIRFPEFTDAWEQRKLGEVGVFNPYSEIPDIFEYVDLEAVVGTELLFHRTENKYTAPSRARRLAKKGDLFYQAVRPYQKNNYLFELDNQNFVFSTGYIQIRPDVDSYFLLSKVQVDDFVNTVLAHCTGTSYPAISSTDLANIEIKIPKSTKEQTAIGNFFKQLDETIALHQRELEKYKQIKQAYLEKMFV